MDKKRGWQSYTRNNALSPGSYRQPGHVAVCTRDSDPNYSKGDRTGRQDRPVGAVSEAAKDLPEQ